MAIREMYLKYGMFYDKYTHSYRCSDCGNPVNDNGDGLHADICGWRELMAMPAHIDEAASDKLKRYAQVGEAAEALMFANGEFTARYYDADKGRVRVYQYKKIIGEGTDLHEALQDATKEGWLG